MSVCCYDKDNSVEKGFNQYFISFLVVFYRKQILNHRSCYFCHLKIRLIIRKKNCVVGIYLKSFIQICTSIVMRMIHFI